MLTMVELERGRGELFCQELSAASSAADGAERCSSLHELCCIECIKRSNLQHSRNAAEKSAFSTQHVLGGRPRVQAARFPAGLSIRSLLSDQHRRQTGTAPCPGSRPPGPGWPSRRARSRCVRTNHNHAGRSGVGSRYTCGTARLTARRGPQRSHATPP